jgi:phosphonate transport system substrate-binding protein
MTVFIVFFMGPLFRLINANLSYYSNLIMIMGGQSGKMKKFLLPLLLASLACSFPVQLTMGTPTVTLLPTPTLIFSPTPAPTAEPGTEENPIILALGPSPRTSDAMIAAGHEIAAFLESRTGYRLVTVAPASENELVDAFSKNNAHIASLSPYGYLLAREASSAIVLLASVRDGQVLYGAQFIANREGGFTSHFDLARNENTADAAAALQQFEEKKPCWSDETSASGYVLPLGLLNQAQVNTRSGAFLEGQPSVVRAVYTEDICDFGATFIDARQSPALEADYPDVLEKVIVIWRAPSVIPYENISISTSLPFEMRRVIQRAFIDLMLDPQGKAAVQAAYGIDELQIAEDAMYDLFEQYVQDSGLDLSELVRQTGP